MSLVQLSISEGSPLEVDSPARSAMKHRPSEIGLVSASILVAALLMLLAGPRGAFAACSDTLSRQNFTGVGRITCPCFAAHEQAGAVFTAPAADYPIEILRVGIGWGSQSGGTPSSLEQAIHVYKGALPNPGSPIFTLDGPVLNDGAINQFDLAPLPGQIVVDSGPFSVTLEFRVQNAGNQFAPSVVHDGNGCQAGKNVVYAIPGGWYDACALGVSGDWIFFVTYRPCASTVDVESRTLLSGPIAALLPIQPNPSRQPVSIPFTLKSASHVRIAVHDLAGRRIADLANGHFEEGLHYAFWPGGTADKSMSPGVYFIDLDADGFRARRTIVLRR